MAVNFHGEHAAILMAESPRNRRNVHTGFDASGCEHVSEIMMSESESPDLFACRIYRTLALTHLHHRSSCEFIRSLRPKTFQKLPHFRNHRNPPNTPVFRACLRVAPHNYLPFRQIAVAPSDGRRLAFAETAEGQKSNQVCTPVVPSAIRLFDCPNQSQELTFAWQLEFFRKHAQPLNKAGKIVVTRTSLNGHV